MHSIALQASSGNKHLLTAIFNSYYWRMSRSQVKKVLDFLVQHSQHQQVNICGVTIDSGQYHSSQRLIADDINLTDSMINTALKGLTKMGLIKVKPLPSRKGSIITVLNFEYYSTVEIAEPKIVQDWSQPNPGKHSQLSADDYDIRQIQHERVAYKFVWTTEAEDYELIASVYGGDPEALRIAKEDLNDWLKYKKLQYKYKNGHFKGLQAGTTPHDKYMKRQAAKQLVESRNNIQAADAAYVPVESDEPPADPEAVADMVKDFCNNKNRF